MNYLPTQSAPILKFRSSKRSLQTTNYLTVSASNICACTGDQTYNACTVVESSSDCDADRAPKCDGGAYGCECYCSKE